MELVIRNPTVGTWTIKHEKLKEYAVKLLEKSGAQKIIVEAHTSLGYVVDVLGKFRNGKTVAVECGKCSSDKIEALKESVTVVIHLPFCYTPELVLLPFESLLNKIEDALMEV